MYAYLFVTLAVQLILVASSVTGNAQSLPLCPSPYHRVEIGAPIYKVLFDGSKLWVVYPAGDKTDIALYTLQGGSFIQRWVSSLPGKPLAIATDDKLNLLAVATDAKKVAVFDIHGRPVLYLERGVRGKPLYIDIVKLKDEYDVIVIEEFENGYWVYAYSLNYTRRPAEAWFPAPPALGLTKYKLVPVLIAGSYGALPSFAVVWVNTTTYNYTGILVQGDEVIIDLYNLTIGSTGSLEFTKWFSFKVQPGYEINESPYTIQSIDYVDVYYSPLRKKVYAALGLTMVQNYNSQLGGKQLPGTLYAFMLVDSETNTSLVRYVDVNIGTLDFYPLGGKMTAFAATRDNYMLAVGSQDYNMRIFTYSITDGYYYILYSVSLAGPVSALSISPYGQLVIAASTNGQMIAVNGPTGSIYWSLPIGASATTASIYSGYAAVGTQGGTVLAFTNPRFKLYYLGIRVNATSIENETYVLKSNTTIRIVGVYQGCLVNKTFTTTLQRLASSVYFELLPSTSYTVTIDNEILGIVVYNILLTSNVVYNILPSDFHIPYYHLKLCLIDTWRHKPPVWQGAQINVTRLASPTPKAQVIASWVYPLTPSGCLDLLLPRGYYKLMLVSWRYHPEITFNRSQNIVRLWSNVTLTGYVTPYLAKQVVINVQTDYGLPLSNANVTLYDPFSGVRLSRISGAGKVVFTSIPYGNYTVTVTFPYAYPAKALLNLDSDTASLTVTLKPRSYYLVINVVDAETGAPVQPFTFTLLRPFDGYTLTGTVTKHNYVVLKVVYGTYTLTVSAPGYKSYEYKSLVVDRDMMITARLPPVYYQVVFQVKDAVYQRPLPARIIVINEETGRRYNLMALHGTATVQLRRGNYTVIAISPYAYPRKLKVVIASSTEITIPVTPRNFTVTVVPIDARAEKPLAALGYNATGYIYCKDTGNWTLRWNGYALVTMLPYSTSCILHVGSRWYMPATVNLGVIASNKTIDVALTPIEFTVTLSVTSIEGVKLDFNATFSGGPLNQTVSVSGYGAASVTLRPGRYRLIIFARYYMPLKTVIVVNKSLKLAFRLKPKLYTVSILVLDAQTGRQVKGATILIARTVPVRSREYTLIAENGFASVPLPWGTYTLTVTAPGYLKSTETIRVPQEKSVTVTLEPIKYKVKVEVRDYYDGMLVPDATLTFYGVRTGIAFRVIAPKGTATIELREDTYRVTVAAPYYQPYSATLRITSNRKLTFRLKPVNYTLTIIVYDGMTRKPIHEPWTIKAISLIYKHFTITATFKTPTATIELPRGKYRIEITAKRYQPQTIKTLTLYAPVSKKVFLARETYSVTFKVIDTRGAPVSNAIITARCLDNGQVLFTGVTGKDGTATANLPWCRYEVRIEAGGYFPKTIFVTIQSNGQVIPVIIKPTMAKIVLDLLPAIIIAGAVVGTGAWVGIRVRRKPAGAELLEEEI